MSCLPLPSVLMESPLELHRLPGPVPGACLLFRELRLSPMSGRRDHPSSRLLPVVVPMPGLSAVVLMTMEQQSEHLDRSTVSVPWSACLCGSLLEESLSALALALA